MAIIYNPDLVASPLESASGSILKFDPERGVMPGSSQESAPSIKGPAESKFEQALKETVNRVNETQNAADRSVARLAAGQEPNIHHTMIELEQAEISMRLAMQVRSKVLEAYQEVMRMQV